MPRWLASGHHSPWNFLHKGFHLHFEFTDEVDLLFRELPRDAMPLGSSMIKPCGLSHSLLTCSRSVQTSSFANTIERLFPHLAAVMKVGHKTKKAAMAAAKEAMQKEREGLKE